MTNVLVVIEAFNGEFKKVALEAICYGKAVSEKLSSSCFALVLGHSDAAGQLGVYGADRILQISGSIALGDNQSLTQIIASQAQSLNTPTIIMPHNSTTKGIVGRLAVRLSGGCISGVIGLPEIAGTEFTVERSVFAGKAKAKISISSEYKILSLAPSAISLTKSGEGKRVEQIEIVWPSNLARVIETKRMTGHIPLPEAELVVSAGRGMKDPGNWAIVEDLASALGATTACSRPVADSGWRPHHEHVGQTGIAIKPNLYIALGISGAIQHLAGVNNSKVIVVINKDPEAPFFKAADYGVCADLFEVVPKLTEAIKKIKQAHG